MVEANNPLYRNISLNTEWEVSWENSEFSSFLTNNKEISNVEQYSNGDELHVLDTNNVGGTHEDENNISSEGCMVENMDDSNNILQTQEDDLELVQDQDALDCKLQLTGPPLPSVVELEDREASIYSCAPGENNAPQYVLLDKDCEVLAFPDMFPTGVGGYERLQERETKLPLRKYYQQQLLNIDG